MRPGARPRPQPVARSASGPPLSLTRAPASRGPARGSPLRRGVWHKGRLVGAGGRGPAVLPGRCGRRRLQIVLRAGLGRQRQLRASEGRPARRAAGREGRLAPRPGGGRRQQQQHQRQQQRRPPRGARRGHGGGARPRSHARRAGSARGGRGCEGSGQRMPCRTREVSEVRLRAQSPPQKLWGAAGGRPGAWRARRRRPRRRYMLISPGGSRGGRLLRGLTSPAERGPAGGGAGRGQEGGGGRRPQSGRPGTAG